MYYGTEKPAYMFEFWGGAKDKLDAATDEQRQAVYDRLEEVFYTFNDSFECDVNDFVWFDCDDIFDSAEDD